MRSLEIRMGLPEVYGDAAAFERTLAAHTREQEAFERLGGYRYEARCRQASQDVGFKDMDRIEKPIFERERMGLQLDGGRGSAKVLEITDLDKVYDDTPVLLGLDLLIWRGERVGLIGQNGTGKSVLLRCILGQETPTSGTITIGPSIRVAYYAQQHETLDPDRTLIEEIWEARSMSEHAAVNFLRRFLFPYQRTRDRVRNRCLAVSAAGSTGQAHAHGRKPAAPRRAHQQPRPAILRGTRRGPRRLRGDHPGDLSRPLLPQSDGHTHRRASKKGRIPNTPTTLLISKRTAPNGATR